MSVKLIEEGAFVKDLRIFEELHIVTISPYQEGFIKGVEFVNSESLTTMAVRH